jgi:hypothetical protein
MAVAAGLTVYELAALAVLAVAALFTATPAGQKATREGVKAIGDAIENAQGESETTDIAPPTTVTDCPDKDRPCPPCTGQLPAGRIDRVPRSKPHFPCPGDHYHYFTWNQDPKTCKCYPKKQVMCLDQGGFPPPGL